MHLEMLNTIFCEFVENHILSRIQSNKNTSLKLKTKL